VKSIRHLVDIYYRSVGRNSVLLLNIPPDRRGLFHENDVARLRELRTVLDETFKTNLAAGKPVTAGETNNEHPAKGITDGDPLSYWIPNEAVGASFEVDLGGAATFDRAMIQEQIRTGQRVESFVLEVPDGQGWREIARATTIGYKRLLRFPEVTAARVRVTILDARDRPTISEFGLFKASAKENN